MSYPSNEGYGSENYSNYDNGNQRIPRTQPPRYGRTPLVVAGVALVLIVCLVTFLQTRGDDKDTTVNATASPTTTQSNTPYGFPEGSHPVSASPSVDPSLNSIPALPPVAPSSTASPTAAPKPKPSAPPAGGGGGVIPAKGVMMRAGVTPSNPNAVRVISPNASPVAKPSALRGPLVRIGCGDNPERLNSMSLSAGTVVEFERGCSWGNVRIVARGNGTASQPILFHSVGDPNKPAPSFSAQKGGRNKDDGIFNLEGSHMHMSGLTFKDSGSIAIGANGSYGVLDNIEAYNVVSGAWIRGDGTKVWNSYMHNLRMMGDTPGANDDYGANGLTVEANNVVVEGLTCRKCLASSADYDQWGGDGSFVEVWQKGENLRVSYGYVDSSARVLEAGGLSGSSARNMSLRYVFARDITDSPFYLNDSGDYSRIDTSGFTQSNNSITER